MRRMAGSLAMRCAFFVIMCAGVQPVSAEDFVPEKAFAGRSEGTGSLRLFWRKERTYVVENLGELQPDGNLRLEQTVHFDGEPIEHRKWLIHPLGAGRYSATLSDATGPVTGYTSGNRLELRYGVKLGGLIVMHQTLELKPDGSMANDGIVRFLGIPIGHLHETIRPKP